MCLTTTTKFSQNWLKQMRKHGAKKIRFWKLVKPDRVSLYRSSDGITYTLGKYIRSSRSKKGLEGPENEGKNFWGTPIQEWHEGIHGYTTKQRAQAEWRKKEYIHKLMRPPLIIELECTLDSALAVNDDGEFICKNARVIS